MSADAAARRSDPSVNPPDPAETPELGYDAHVRAELAKARAELDAGRGIPAAEVWKELGRRVKVIFSPRSVRQLHEIQAYIAYDSPNAAARVVTRIRQSVEILADFPQARAALRGQSKS